MLLMMAEVIQLSKVSAALPGNRFWQFLASQQTHVDWAGCSLHDLIQPSFSFLVGVALPYSLASRRTAGAPAARLFGHALWRSIVLILLGIFLRSTHSAQTNFTFEDTLTQIGLGYPILFLLGFQRPRWQWTAFGALLFGYWLAWALYPIPGPGFDYATVKVPADWPHHFSGFAAHWNKNSNLGQAFDQWFLNLFPRPKPFVANAGGYLTLSFIPTLGTMLLGLFAGQWLREAAPKIPFRRFLLAGLAGIVFGLILHVAGVCPIVKRIWTPSWTLFSGGLCFLLLSGFCWIIEVRGHRRWALPLVVIGVNSIAAYLMAHLWEQFLIDSLKIHFGTGWLNVAGPEFAPLWRGLVVLTLFWLALLWMYRRRIYLRV